MLTNKTLYVSDLDGTLLTPDAKISNRTADVLNALIDNGMAFSIATARTAATVSKIMENVHLNIPVVLMNGVALFDTRKRSYVSFELMPKTSLEHIFTVLDEFGMSGFLFVIDKQTDDFSTLYTKLDSPASAAYMNERIHKYNKKFTKVNDFREQINTNIVYYSITDKKEVLDPIYDRLKDDNGLHINYYYDVYNEGVWFLEASSANASKFKAVTQLKGLYGFDKAVGFGDNSNDLPLFDACSECFAVENARPEVKARANSVIGANTEDGVALKLQSLFGREG